MNHAILRCPVCGQTLTETDRTLRCEQNHCFDIAKEGYCNLNSAHRSGDNIGDNKDMARSRRDFLNKGFYAPLAEAVSQCVDGCTQEGDSVLDICCGEGYYTEYLTKRLERDFYGFDLSKNMVRLAAKRHCGATFFVANIARIPIADGSVKAAFHLFAPFQAAEFGRILAKDGTLFTAIPGRRHLFGLKEVLYDTPYENDEQKPQADGLKLTDELRVKGEITLESQDDIQALFQMTPYYYHTPSKGMARLEQLGSLTTEIEFVIAAYQH